MELSWLNNKREEIAQVANNFDIIILSETWLLPKFKVYLPIFTIIHKDINKPHSGGLAIAIKNDISFENEPGIYSTNKILDTLVISILTP